MKTSSWVPIHSNVEKIDSKAVQMEGAFMHRSNELEVEFDKGPHVLDEYH